MFNFKKLPVQNVEWKDNLSDSILFCYQHPKNEKLTGETTLKVRPSQVAIFVHKDEICDMLEPGNYLLSTENLPLLTKLLYLPAKNNVKIDADIYFIKTKPFMKLKWEFKNLEKNISGNGNYSFKICNPKLFLQKFSEIEDGLLIPQISKLIDSTASSCMIDKVEEREGLPRSLEKFSKGVLKEINQRIEKYGLQLVQFEIENAKISKATKHKRDLNQIHEKTKIIEKLQKNGEKTENSTIKSKKSQEFCPHCHERVNKNAKVCANCGFNLRGGKICPNCMTKVFENDKHCPVCGEKLK